MVTLPARRVAIGVGLAIGGATEAAIGHAESAG